MVYGGAIVFLMVLYQSSFHFPYPLNARLALDRVTEKWTMSIRNWGQVYGELSIMYEGRLPE